MSKENNKELLNCPFCGGEAELNLIGDFRFIHCFKVTCKECGCTQDISISDEEVVEAWNTRIPMQNIVERLEEELATCQHYDRNGKCIYEETARKDGISKAIEIVKEEGELNERKTERTIVADN